MFLSPLQSATLVLGLPLLLISCGDAGGPSMDPVGDGLRFLGVALVAAVLLAVLGMSRKGGGGPHG